MVYVNLRNDKNISLIIFNHNRRCAVVAPETHSATQSPSPRSTRSSLIPDPRKVLLA